MEVFSLFCSVLRLVVCVAGSPSPHVAFVIGTRGHRSWLVSAFAVAFLAVNGPVWQRLEGHGAGFAALGTFCVKVHLN